MAGLEGSAVLVAEDEFVIALDLQLALYRLAHIRERQDAYGPAWNRDLRPATRNNLRRPSEGSGLTSLSGADP